MVKKLGRRKRGKKEECRTKDVQNMDLTELSKAAAVAKNLRKAATDVEMFCEFSASGKGLQTGGRGNLLDFNELVCILEKIKVIPQHLQKEDCYDFFLAFIRRKMRTAVGTCYVLSLPLVAETFKECKHSPASICRGTTVYEGKPQSSDGPEDELDFPQYQEFMEFLVDKLGYLPYVEREKEILTQHMESLKLRTTNLYDFSYRSSAIRRTDRELRKTIGHNEEILFNNDPIELAQTKYSLPILPAYKIRTPRAVLDMMAEEQNSAGQQTELEAVAQNIPENKGTSNMTVASLSDIFMGKFSSASLQLDDLRHGEELRGLRLPAHRVARKSVCFTKRKCFDKWVSVVARFDEALFENDDRTRRFAKAANPDDGTFINVNVDRSRQWIPFLPRAIPPIDHNLFPFAQPLSSHKI